MRRTRPWLSLVGLALVGLSSFPRVLSAEDVPAAIAARAKEIEAMLPERPAAFGRPITDRAAWEKPARHETYKDVVSRAERYLNRPIPDLPDELFIDFAQTGNRRSRFSKHDSDRRRRIPWLVLAECLENKGRFVPAFEALVRAICSEKTWVSPAHDRKMINFRGERIDIDLGSATLAHVLATADYLLADRLSPEVRQLLRDNIRRRVLSPYRDMVTGKRKINWWMRTTSNWNAVCLAGTTGAGLAVLDSREGRALLVAAAEHYSQNFLKGFPPDGYCTEGLGYWNYGFGHYVVLCGSIRQATGGRIDLMAREGAREPAEFGARIEIANGVYPAFADCSVGTRPNAATMWFVSRRFRLGLRRWEAYDPVRPLGALYSAMMFSFPNSASETPPAEQAHADIGPRTWFRDAGILICRPGGRRECTLAAALKGGHNAEHHNHNDVGSYVVVAGAQAVLVDPGAEVYSGRTFSKDRYLSNVLNSFGHSVPVVAGTLQRKGREAAVRVIETSFTDTTDTFAQDLSAAYDVAELKTLERTFVYSRTGAGSLTVTDRVAFSEPKAFGTAVVTLGRWKRLGPCKLLVYDTESALEIDVAVDGGEAVIEAEEIKEDVRTPTLPTRIGIRMARPVASASIALTIRPAAQAGPMFRNGDFEAGRWAWRMREGGMGSLSTEQAASGTTSLKIVDPSKTLGSSITSARMPIDTPGPYILRGKIYRVSGSGVGLYVRCLDKSGVVLNMNPGGKGWTCGVTTVSGPTGKWKAFATPPITAPEGTVALQLWIHSSSNAVVEAYLDDLEMVPRKAGLP